MVRSCLSHGECFTCDGESSCARQSRVRVKSVEDIGVARAAGITASDVQPRRVRCRSPSGGFGNDSQGNGVAPSRSAFHARCVAECDGSCGGWLDEANQLSDERESSQENYFDDTALQKSGLRHERKIGERLQRVYLDIAPGTRLCRRPAAAA